jgi:hypothetical protein
VAGGGSAARPAPLPWPDLIRAALAICVPLSAAFAVGPGTLGVLPAMGGLMGTMADTGGSYPNRVKRVTSAAVLGGAAGLAVGSVIHGHGWIAVLALTLVAGVSGVVSALGDIGSSTGHGAQGGGNAAAAFCRRRREGAGGLDQVRGACAGDPAGLGVLGDGRSG